MLLADPRAPQVLVLVQQRLGVLDQCQAVVEVAVADGGRLTALGQATGGVLADRLEQSVARPAVAMLGDHEGLVDQPPDGVQHAAASGADRARRREVEAAGEHGEAAEDDAFGFVEQVMAPLDRGRERLLAFGRAAGAPHEQREAVVEPALDLARRQGPQPRGGELERQRHAVQPLAHPAQGLLVGRVQREPRANLAAALEEERERVVVAERGHVPDGFAGDAERLAAGREHGDLRAGLQQRPRDLRGSVEHVLAVVQADQQAARGQCRRQ